MNPATPPPPDRSPATPGPPVVTLTVWGVPPRGVPAALIRMALDRRALRGVPGLRFAKLLGTGSGESFTVRDADPLHWALLAVWDGATPADAFVDAPAHRRWDRLARERLEVRMVPIASRGKWSGQQPFDAAPGSSHAVAGDQAPVAAVTRARLRWHRAANFWRAVPAVSADLRSRPGLLLAVGIGELPVGLQGTFSVWRSPRDLQEFAYRRAPHAEVVRRTPVERWYVEELFARFRVQRLSGHFGGRRHVWPPAPPPGHPT